MLILQIACWTFIGLILVTVQALIMNDDRGLGVLALAFLLASIGGMFGLRFFGESAATGFSLIAMITAAAFCAAGLIFFDLVRKPRDHVQ